MKIIKTASGHRLQINRDEWESIGKEAKWHHLSPSNTPKVGQVERKIKGALIAAVQEGILTEEEVQSLIEPLKSTLYGTME